MELVYKIIYWALDILSTYCMYRMIKTFHVGKCKNRYIEIGAYSLLHVLNAIIAPNIGSVAWNFTITLIMTVLVTFVYRSSMKRRLLSVAVVATVVNVIELATLTYIAQEPLQFLNTTESNLVYYAICKCVIFVVMLLFTVHNKEEYQKNLDKKIYWFAPIAVSVFMSYILYIFQSGALNREQVLVGIIFVMITVAAVLYLYHSIQVKEQNARKLLVQENANYLRQYELLKASTVSLDISEHDMKNHIITLKAIVGDNPQALRYLDMMGNFAKVEGKYLDTGNMTIDSILNVKLFEAEDKEIIVDHQIFIPINLNADEFTMTTILGNLMDAAIRETLLTEGEKKIRLVIRYDRGRLLLWLFHPSAGHKQNGSKAEYVDHLCVESVKKAVDNYFGRATFDLVENTWEISILMFIPSKEEKDK